MTRFKFDGKCLYNGSSKVAEVRGDGIYSGANKVGEVRRDHIYKGASQIGEVRGDNVYSHGSRIGSLSDAKKDIDGPGGTVLAALWILFVR